MDTSVDGAKQALRVGSGTGWNANRRSDLGYMAAFRRSPGLMRRPPGCEAARVGFRYVMKAVPDQAQQPVRERALRDGKLVYMPVPMLAEDPPFTSWTRTG